jgi:hypothetical protein
VKPLTGVTVTVYAALPPAATATGEPGPLTVKSGVGACTTTVTDADSESFSPTDALKVILLPGQQLFRSKSL